MKVGDFVHTYFLHNPIYRGPFSARVGRLEIVASVTQNVVALVIDTCVFEDKSFVKLLLNTGLVGWTQTCNVKSFRETEEASMVL